MLQKLKRFLASAKTREVVDIVLFGSAAKGKALPRDIDICVIFRESILIPFVNELEKKAKKAGLNLHISSLTVDNFFSSPHSLIRAVLREGISLSTGKPIAEQYGLSSRALYSYSLKNMKPSDKVRFVYAAKGRKEEGGFVGNINGQWIADSCFIAPIERDNEVIELFKRWDVSYKRKPLLLIS